MMNLERAAQFEPTLNILARQAGRDLNTLSSVQLSEGLVFYGLLKKALFALKRQRSVITYPEILDMNDGLRQLLFDAFTPGHDYIFSDCKELYRATFKMGANEKLLINISLA